MPREGLGEFEQTVMLAIVHLERARAEAYGVTIVDDIERRTGRDVARAAVYIALRRLEDKGLVRSWMGDPTAEVGGRAKRLAALTPQGFKALKESRDFLNTMWRGIDLPVKGGRA